MGRIAVLRSDDGRMSHDLRAELGEVIAGTARVERDLQ